MARCLYSFIGRLGERQQFFFFFGVSYSMRYVRWRGDTALVGLVKELPASRSLVLRSFWSLQGYHNTFILLRSIQ